MLMLVGKHKAYSRTAGRKPAVLDPPRIHVYSFKT